jgi:hypothetical protein
MSSLASIVEENLQGFLEIFIPTVECLENRLANHTPKVEQQVDQSLTRVERSLVEFVQILKNEAKHQSEVVKHEQTTYQQIEGVIVEKIVDKQIEGVNV